MISEHVKDMAQYSALMDDFETLTMLHFHGRSKSCRDTYTSIIPASSGTCIRASNPLSIIIFIGIKRDVGVSRDKESMSLCFMKVPNDPLNCSHVEMARFSHVNDVVDIWLSNHQLEQTT